MSSRPPLKPCHNKASCKSEDKGDPSTKLPIDIVLSIISSFTMKEAARLGLVSRHWQFIWRCFPLLILEDPRAMERVSKSWEAFSEERPSFVRWVDRVLEQHLGAVINELRITFDLDHNWQSHVDKWANIALDKHVKRLELDFSSRWRNCHTNSSDNDFGTAVCGEPLELPPKFASIKSSLRFLSLKYVNATDEFIDCLPRSCPLLESLCIIGSKRITKVSGSLEHVKRLEVSRCCNLKMIDISAPQLCSFVYHNHPIELLHIANASSLTDVSIGEKGNLYNIAYVFDSLSEYFSQLVHLTLRMTMKDLPFGREPRQLNLGINNPPALPNLQHLELQVFADFVKSLRGWSSLITASPSLRQLTLKLNAWVDEFDWPILSWAEFPLKSLKTLELVGYVGKRIDLELAYFVFENASMLEEVIVDFVPLFLKSYDNNVRKQLVLIETKLPPGVKLTIK